MSMSLRMPIFLPGAMTCGHLLSSLSLIPSLPPSLPPSPHSVEFQFRHNVVGRRVYAEGTVDALVFLAKQAGSQKKVYDMIDVLKAGAM